MTWMPYLMIPLSIAFVIYSLAKRKKQHAQLAEQNAHLKAGELAKAMGLELVQGDPETNFVYARHFLIKNNGSMPETVVRLQGEVQGRRTELYYRERRVSGGVGSRRIEIEFACALKVQVGAAFPEFEVHKKHMPHWGKELKPQMAAPTHHFGDAGLDAQLALKTQDPRIVAAIADGLRPLANTAWVHIYGDGDSLRFLTSLSSVSAMLAVHDIHGCLQVMAQGIERVAAGAQAPMGSSVTG